MGVLGTIFTGAAVGVSTNQNFLDNGMEAIVAAPSKGPGWGSTGPGGM